MRNKKAQGMSIQTVIILALGLVVFLALIFIFRDYGINPAKIFLNDKINSASCLSYYTEQGLSEVDETALSQGYPCKGQTACNFMGELTGVCINTDDNSPIADDSTSGCCIPP